ncbi:MAG: LysR substrate-binding domain-containing protein, partial [Chitinophagaceae bacterium]
LKLYIMTLVQLEYIIAVDKHRHFAKAAAHCFVTQPSLSTQIQKLEEELGVKIFDRNKQPVLPTDAGKEIIEQAHKILAEASHLNDIVDIKKGKLSGELRIGIIPTLAPYILPLFIQAFTKSYPDIRLIITEYTTDIIVSKLREGSIDAGILVTPLQENGIKEDILFYEELIAFVSKKNAAFNKTYMLPKDIDPEKLWLLEEGHCLRSQIVNLCELKPISIEKRNFLYEAGSIDTLKRMVDLYDGITILPELATLGLGAKEQKQLRYFKTPSPVREVSIITHRDFVKKRMIHALKEKILEVLPEKIEKNKPSLVVQIEN